MTVPRHRPGCCPVMAWLRPREVELNPRLVEAAAASRRRGARPVPAGHVRRTRRLWSHDRIHGSPGGSRADRGRHGRAARAPGERRVLARLRAVGHRSRRRGPTRRVVGRDLRRAVPDATAAGARSGRRPYGQAPGPDAGPC
jgi:hypothetical protein